MLPPLLKLRSVVIMMCKLYTARALASAPLLGTTCGPQNSQVLPSLAAAQLVILMHRQYTPRVHGTNAIVEAYVQASELANTRTAQPGHLNAQAVCHTCAQH